jgi:hypothetical protein
MSKAFIDTTILTDYLLKKKQQQGIAAEKELKKFTITELPVYAIKEFKRAPLQHYAYVHNKLIETKSFSKTLNAIKILVSSPYHKRKATTGIEALIEANDSINQNTPPALQRRYGAKATPESIQCDESRFFLHFLIQKAWKNRRSVTTHVVGELFCYEELEPYENKHGGIELAPRNCKKEMKECSMAKALKAKPDILEKLKNSIDPDSTKNEDIKRRQALKALINNNDMTEDICTGLGDAIFSFFAPDDSIIITTNLRDHDPLAKALGKKAKRP